MPCDLEAASAPLDGNTRLEAGVPPLNSLYLYISGVCNLFCAHCWISPPQSNDREEGPFLELEFAAKAVREAKPLGLRSVKLTGGEPLLHPQFRELIDQLSEEDVKILIETNGTRIDDSLAQFLKGRSRVVFISVSMDGVTAQTHEILRGVPGSHERTMDGIRALVGAGYSPQIICTLHRENIDQMADMVQLAERIGCGSVKFNNIQQMGRGEKFTKERGLSVPEIIHLCGHLEKEIIPRSRIPVFFDIPMAFYSIRRLFRDSSHRCALLNILSVLATGELSLCGIGVTTEELVFGHIARDSLKEVWNRNPVLARMRMLIPDQLLGACGRCLHREICLGNCVANNFHRSRELNGSYVFCEKASELGLFPEARKHQKNIQDKEKYDEKKAPHTCL